MVQRASTSNDGAERIVDEVRHEIDYAIIYAEASPMPDVSDLLKDFYTV
jgi:TPP-dependent pyruvate/acetoin dehydrogenase alpha subunit